MSKFLSGRVGKSGYWEPGVINTILGRQLECGKHPWWQGLYSDTSDLLKTWWFWDVLDRHYAVDIYKDDTYLLSIHSISHRKVLFLFGAIGTHTDDGSVITIDVYDYRC